MMAVLHTIGHSSREAQAFVGLLKAHAIELLIDIRAFPRSRRHPHFGRDVLADVLSSRGIAYHWAGDTLGGFRKPRTDSPHVALTDAAFRGFADHLDTAACRTALAALVAQAMHRRIVIMCAEADHRHCHRQFIADTVLRAGLDVRHIGSDGRCTPHRLHGCLDPRPAGGVYNRFAQGELFAPGATP